MWIAIGVAGGGLLGAGLMYAIIAGKFGNTMRGRSNEPWWTYWL
jgi:hypothetical protein